MKIGAIWWRTSTKAQLEISPETQVNEARKALEAKGYVVPERNVLGSDWSSMDLMACPKFQELLRLVESGEIKAVGILDRDRLQAKGVQRLVFISDCRDRDVEIVVAQGPEFMDAPEGQIIELALALGKERANLRAQTGSKNGLRDRVKLKGLPITRKGPFGYGFNEALDTLEPTSDWPTVHRILHWGLEGNSTREISRRLYRMGVPTPMGKPIWSDITICRILSDPTYAGRYHALKSDVVEPKKRRGETFGKSSERRKPPGEWTYMPNIKVVNRPITWEEHLELRARLERNQRYSRRNGKRSYLLRGMILCEPHNRIFHGFVHPNRHAYRCSSQVGTDWGAEKCKKSHLNGEATEESVWEEVMRLLTNPRLVAEEAKRARDGVSETEEALERNGKEAERKLRQSYDSEAHYARLSAEGRLSDEAFDRLMAQVRAQRVWCTEELERVGRDRAVLQAEVDAAMSLEALVKRVGGKLDQASWQEKRMVLEALNTQIRVKADGSVELHLHIPTTGSIVSHSPGLPC